MSASLGENQCNLCCGVAVSFGENIVASVLVVGRESCIVVVLSSMCSWFSAGCSCAKASSLKVMA